MDFSIQPIRPVITVEGIEGLRILCEMVLREWARGESLTLAPDFYHSDVKVVFAPPKHLQWSVEFLKVVNIEAA